MNDWLKAEFEARVRPKRKIELTPRLTVALKKLAEIVTVEDEALETAVLETSRSPSDDSYLPLEPRQTTYLTVPADAAAAARKLIATLRREMDVREYRETDGEVAFALTYPVSYEEGKRYGELLAVFAKMLKGKREMTGKFLK